MISSPFVNRFFPALLTLLLLAGAFMPAAHALVIDGLYDHEIEVQAQGDAERRRAYREALSAVIVKVTGEERWLQSSTAERALRDAQSYVQQVSYRNTTTAGQAKTLISITFDKELVDSMLLAGGMPVWDRNRPSILLWLSVQGVDGQRELLASDSDHPALVAVREFARQRGVPILLPVMDFEDRRNLPADVAWSLDEEAIRKASARYGADSILSGRVLFSSADNLVGLWQFLFRDQVEVFDSFEKDLPTYLHGALNRVSGELATHFAIKGVDTASSRVTLRVEGINDAASYVALLVYIQELAVVDRVVTSLLDGHNVELDVGLSGSPFLFTEFISLGRDLVPADPVFGSPLSADSAASDPLVSEALASKSENSVLNYRWIR